MTIKTLPPFLFLLPTIMTQNHKIFLKKASNLTLPDQRNWDFGTHLDESYNKQFLQPSTEVKKQGAYLQMSLPLENKEDLITSGAIQAYVPAALILVVLCHSRANPKSVIFNVLLQMSLCSIFSRSRTIEKLKMGCFL